MDNQLKKVLSAAKYTLVRFSPQGIQIFLFWEAWKRKWSSSQSWFLGLMVKVRSSLKSARTYRTNARRTSRGASLKFLCYSSMATTRANSHPSLPPMVDIVGEVYIRVSVEFVRNHFFFRPTLRQRGWKFSLALSRNTIVCSFFGFLISTIHLRVPER